MMKKLTKRLHYGGLRFARRFRNGQNGFTLIELLVVIAILGVLAAVAIPNIARFMDSGQNEARETELSNIQTAVIAMMAEAGESTITTGVPADGVQTYAQLEGIYCDSDHPLTEYILGFVDGSELSQAYDIAADGSVTVDVPAEE